MTERQIEMTWRCSSCSARNLGRFKVCPSCGSPKDGSEAYEMPDDPSTAATVTEASLLLMATAGPDWRCAYCGSDSRRSDMGCNNCGASAVEGVEASEPAPSPPVKVVPKKKPVGKVFGVLAACIICGGLYIWNAVRPRDFEARVTDVRWERTIAVQRYQAKVFEGFKEDIPADALSVKSIGQKEHHQEQVFDHTETEHYTVEVPDGFRSESYTERVSCGQDCRTEPKRCHEKCSSNKNGFATCRTECSGGGQTCSTRYCNERRTRQIPKTRSEARTREVPKYRSEPRYAAAFSWTHWDWFPSRTVRLQGTDITTRWPEARLNEDLSPGEKEREERSEQYEVTLSYGKHTLTFKPTSELEFATFAPGSAHALHTEGETISVDHKQVFPTLKN